MPRGNQWTVGENKMAIDPVFDYLGPSPWSTVPPNSQIIEWAKVLYEREPRHSASSWEAKVRDVISCLPILTIKAYNGRPPGSPRRIKDGAQGPSVEGPSTRDLVEGRLAAMSVSSLEDARKDVLTAWQNLGESLLRYMEAAYTNLDVPKKEKKREKRHAPILDGQRTRRERSRMGDQAGSVLLAGKDTKGSMMLAETTVTTARAADLEEGDVVKIGGSWRLLMDVARSQKDILDMYSADPDKKNYGLYPDMKGAYEALGRRWEGDYVVLRYVVQEKSTPAEVEDAVKVTDALDLMEVQVRIERKEEK